MNYSKILRLITISALVVCPMIISAQDAGDFVGTAIGLSRTNPGGSARILGMGGTQTALGGDISSASSNPAGLGFFNRSEFSFTPVFNYIGAETDYLGNSTTDGRLNFNFGNLGAVIKSKNKRGDFKGGSFGVSINRVVDFQQQITYDGFNSVSDFIDFAVDSDNLGNQNDLSDLAFNTTLTDEFFDTYSNQDSLSINGLLISLEDLYPDDFSSLQLGDTLFFVDRNTYLPNGDLAFPNEDRPTFQSETVESRGATNQVSFAYGVNYKDRFYIGGNLGILSLSREVEREYIERPTNSDLTEMTLTDNYEINGVGLNGTIGIIGRPIDNILLGATYTLPTFYFLEQVRTISLTAEFANFNPEFSEILYEPFSYSLRTPSRLNVGATYFLGKSGLISANAERINFSGARFSDPEFGDDFSIENSDINRLASVVWNYGVGAEFRYEVFRFRGGFSLQSDPSDNDLDEAESRFSLGAGIRTRDYFVDLAAIASSGRNSAISPYPGQEAVVNNQNIQLALSFGFFF